MVRKRRTPVPVGGESSGPRETEGGQSVTQHPPIQQQQPPQQQPQGGYQGEGRGLPVHQQQQPQQHPQGGYQGEGRGLPVLQQQQPQGGYQGGGRGLPVHQPQQPQQHPQGGYQGGGRGPPVHQQQQPQQHTQGGYQGGGRGWGPQYGGLGGQGSGGVGHPQLRASMHDQPGVAPPLHFGATGSYGSGGVGHPQVMASLHDQPRANPPSHFGAAGGRGYGGVGHPQVRASLHDQPGATPPLHFGAAAGRGYGGVGPCPPQVRASMHDQPGGTPPLHFGATGGRGAYSSGGLSRHDIPGLHQATQPPLHQAGMRAEPSLSVVPTETPVVGGSSSEPKPPELSEAAPTQAIIPASSKSIRFPSRPVRGTIGIKCTVKANHFLAELPDKELHHYDVTITPEIASRGVNRAVMCKLIDIYRESHLGKRLPAYDGRKSLYTAGPLPFSLKEFKIVLTDDERTGESRKEREFKVVIKWVACVDLHHLGMFLQGKQADAPQEALHILDIVLRELPTRPNSSYILVGRCFYSSKIARSQPLGDGLESWRGFYQSIRPTQMGLSLNIDMSSTAFIEAMPVIDFVAQLLNRDAGQRPLSDADRVKVKKALRGVRVEVIHRGNMRRKYRISGLTTQSTHELTFPVEDSSVTKRVVEYFKEAYGYVIKHTQWPCLQVGNTQRPNYLPMEVCKIVEGQRFSKRLNEKQITALLKVACQRPSDRENDINVTMHRNAYSRDAFSREFGLKINQEMARVEARILPAPWLKYHDTGREKDCLPQVGQWNMMNKKVVNGGTVGSWICINFSRNVQDNIARRFCTELAQMCMISGMNFNPDPVFPPTTARPDQVESVLKARFSDAMARLRQKELDLLVVILPDNNGPLYGDLKRVCETELGIVSQCCLTKHVFKMSKQYLANVALKINVKVGGRNTVLVDALSRRIPLVSDRPTIIFGADVTHPAPGEDSSPSISAVVASHDWPEVAKYAGLVSAQAHREELIQDLYTTRGDVPGGMIMDLLKSYHRETRRKPQRIIFYRDGVSEGQFYQVLFHELDAIRKACAALEPNYQPPVTFVVVQKRHHTRLFANNHRDRNSTDRSGNILPGTVVDTKICHPTEFDFYLCSHAGIQGTSRPAHYHVLWDENNFSSDALQSLTNNLCYTYARCTRSVSIVPPAYYAHLAAFRARFYMEKDASDCGGDASSRGGCSGAGRNTRTSGVVKPLPALKDNVKKVMFYC